MQAQIKKNNAAQEFETVERCAILEVANDADDREVSIARARVKPGITTAWHKLTGITERYLIVSGQGHVELADMEPVVVCEGDVVRIPAGTAQRITNTSEVDLIFYAICSPRFQQCYYVA
ncbi:MAG TPA: cupin domain-containing protein, partial [Gammaproteobacteria bacterium]|nr:cupin domain-containing protein [Gammaproteobacteria bacterium]